MNYTGKLNMILGCMFSEKTSHLLTRFMRYKRASKKCLLVKFKNDTRYADLELVTHNGVRAPAVSCLLLEDIDKLVSEYDVICIDEIQFFLDAPTYCDKFANMGKIVEVCGLNGNSKREPWDIISKLIPMAEDILFLKAVCEKTGNDAIYSKRIVANDQEVLIGGAEAYCAVDRQTYFN